MAKRASPSLRGQIARVMLLVLLPLLALVFPPVEARVTREWERRYGPLDRSVLSGGGIMILRMLPAGEWFVDDPDRRYSVDALGRVREAVLRRSGITRLEEVPGLAGLGELRTLDLSGNPLSGTIDVSRYPRLRILRLADTRVTAVRGLERLSELRLLDLSGTAIQDMEGLRGMGSLGKLAILRLSRTPVRGTLDLSGQPRLLRLEAAGTRLRTVTGLAAAPALDQVDLAGSPVERLDGIGGARSLDLSRTPITDLTPLAGAPRLRGVALDGVDLGRVRGLEVLRPQALSLRGARGVDLARLRGGGVMALLLDRSDTRDLGPLRGWTALRILTLRGTQVRDLAPLRDLPRLAVLGVDGQASAPPSLAAVGAAVRVLRDEDVEQMGFLPAGEGRRAGRTLGALLLAWLLTWLPLPRRLRTPRGLRLRGLLRFAAGWGGFVLCLHAAARGMLPGFRDPVADWANLTAAALAGVLVLKLLLAETRLGTRGWWAVAGTATVRAVPIALVGGMVVLLAVLLSRLDGWVGMFGTAAAAVFSLVVLYLLYTFAGYTVLTWKRARSAMRAGLAGRIDRDVLIVATLRFGGAGVRAGATGIALRRTGDDRRPFATLFALDPSMLAGCPVTAAVRTRLRGVLVEAHAEDLQAASRRDVAALGEWLRGAYRETWAPLWLLGDWVGGVDAGSPAVAAGVRALAPFRRYLAGFAHQAGGLLEGTVADRLPGPVRAALRLNQRVPAARLEELGLPRLLREGATPAAAQLRSVFSLPGRDERLHQLCDAAQTGVAFMALALAAELDAEAGSAGGGKLRRALGHLERPTFLDWESVLNAFRARGATPLAAALRAWGDAPCGAAREAAGLARVLVDAGVPDVAWEADASRARALALVRQARNSLSAHGSATTAPAAYDALLGVVVDLLAALPWEAAVLHAGGFRFRGCLPEADRSARDGEPALRMPAPDGSSRRVPAGAWFAYVATEDAVALHAGEGLLQEPLSGTFVERAVAAHA